MLRKDERRCGDLGAVTLQRLSSLKLCSNFDAMRACRSRVMKRARVVLAGVIPRSPRSRE